MKIQGDGVIGASDSAMLYGVNANDGGADGAPAPKPEGDAKPDDPVAKKMAELLGETKAERAKRRELEAKLAEYEQAKAAQEDEAAKKRGEFDKLEAQLKAERDTIAKKYQDALIGGALKSALVSAGVAAPFMEAAEAMMRLKGVSLDKDDTPILDGKPLGEFVAEWAKSDAGKAFVAAPNSSGGGATGGGAAGAPQAGNMGGTPAERQAAIAAKFKLPIS